MSITFYRRLLTCLGVLIVLALIGLGFYLTSGPGDIFENGQRVITTGSGEAVLYPEEEAFKGHAFSFSEGQVMTVEDKEIDGVMIHYLNGFVRVDYQGWKGWVSAGLVR